MYKSHRTLSARTFDHLYDPLFVTSGFKDIQREHGIALAKSATKEIIPIYNTMFSDLYQNSKTVYVTHDIGLPPIYPQTNRRNVQVHVRGSDRPKFFTSSPKTFSITDKRHQDITQEGECVFPDNEFDEKFKDKGCQTLYRESSAQTKPWMPKAIIVDSAATEIVNVADLLKEDNFPGRFEIEVILRDRKKRNWEKTLQSASQRKNSNFKNEQLVRQAFEWEKIIAREAEIDELQHLRLQFVKSKLKDREDNLENIAKLKYENRMKEIEYQRREKIIKLQTEHERNLRKQKFNLWRSQNKNVWTKGGNYVNVRNNFYTKFNESQSKMDRENLFGDKYDLSDLWNQEDKSKKIKKFLNEKVDLWKPKETAVEISRGFLSDKNLKSLYLLLKSFREKYGTEQKAGQKCLHIITDSNKIIKTDLQKSELIENNTELVPLIPSPSPEQGNKEKSSENKRKEHERSLNNLLNSISGSDGYSMDENIATIIGSVMAKIEGKLNAMHIEEQEKEMKLKEKKRNTEIEKSLRFKLEEVEENEKEESFQEIMTEINQEFIDSILDEILTESTDLVIDQEHQLILNVIEEHLRGYSKDHIDHTISNPLKLFELMRNIEIEFKKSKALMKDLNKSM